MTMDETVRIDNLSVRSDMTNSFILKNITFTINKGECVVLKGHSGAGKTVLAHSIIGLTNSGLTVTSGSLSLGTSSYNLSNPTQLSSLRGSSIASAFQLPLESFNPLIKVGEQIADSLKTHRPLLKPEERRTIVEKKLRTLGFDDPKMIFNAHPHQLSVGQLQRCILSSVTLLDTKLLIVDEPTASLDAKNAEFVINLLYKLKTEYAVSILLITHDESIIPKIATKTLYIYKGELQFQLKDTKQSPFGFSNKSTILVAPTLLKVEGLSKSFKEKRKGLFQSSRKKIFEGVSFNLKKGEVLGIVGPSGSGKTTLAKCLVGLLQPDTGSIKIDGRRLLKRQPLQVATTLGIYYLWQNPVNCLDPKMNVKGLLTQPLSRSLKTEKVERSVNRVIKIVGLPTDILARRPSEISGGQAQRVVIARLLQMEIQVLVADEPVSYLDRDNKLLTIMFLLRLVKEVGLSIILISHDQEIISSYCNRSLTLTNGGIYEN